MFPPDLLNQIRRILCFHQIYYKPDQENIMFPPDLLNQIRRILCFLQIYYKPDQDGELVRYFLRQRINLIS